MVELPPPELLLLLLLLLLAMAACCSSFCSSSCFIFFFCLPTVRCTKPYLCSSVHSLKPPRRPSSTLPAFRFSSPSPSPSISSSSVCFSFSTSRPQRPSSILAAFYSSSSSSLLPMDQQFEEFRVKLEESGSLREKLRVIVADLDTVTRLMQAQLLLVHHSRPSPDILAKVKAHIDQVRTIYRQLAEVLKSVPGQYYRYHDHWRNQTYTVVFLLAFIHWLETGGLLSHSEAASLLGLQDAEFELDLEDYLVGLCNLSNELPRFVVNQVTTGDYDCAKRASVFLSDLYAAFRMLNLRNDLLRKRFDGMKYDLKKVEEVLYDVKIRGLLGDPTQSDNTA